MWNVARYVVVLQLALAVSGVQLRLRNQDGQEFSNHSVVLLAQIHGGGNNRLVCTVPNNRDCCWRDTMGHWYHPNGTQVSSDSNKNIYRRRGGQGEEWAAVYLHWRGETYNIAHKVGLFRCEIPASGADGDIQTIYVGVYRASEPFEGRPTVTDLVFHLDTVSTDPFQSGPPVFTLTCSSSGGPATDVVWKKGSTKLSADSDHNMTKSLVDQSGPDYSSTLTVREARTGMYRCTVSNSRGESVRAITIGSRAAAPLNPTAVQRNGTASVVVSWTAPSSGPTPSGYRIYYQAEGDQMFTTVDIEHYITEYVLTDLQPLTTYTIGIVTLSSQLPSEVLSLEPLTVGIPPNITSTVVESPQSVRITWRQQSGVERYEIGFERTTGSEQLQCPQFQHSGTKSISPTSGEGIAEYTLTDLEENSVYTISLTAVDSGGLWSAISTTSITTLTAAPSGSPNITGTASSTSVYLQWDDVECIDQNSMIMGYRLWYTNVSSQTKERTQIEVSDDTRTYTISGLRPFTNYSIELAAVNTDSQIGPKATTVVQTHQGNPGPVQYLMTTSHITSIELTWSAPVLPNGIITAYEVSHQLQGGMELERVNTTDVSATHALTGLRPQTTCTVTVRAYTLAGSGEESSVTVTSAEIPLVQNVQVDVLNDTYGVQVSWDPIADPEISGYQILYTTTSSPTNITQRNVSSSEPLPIAISGLSPGVEYRFQVLAVVETEGEVLLGENSTDVKIKTRDKVERDNSKSSTGGDDGAAIGAVLAVMVVIISVIVVTVFILFRYRKKHGRTHKLSSITTTDCAAYGTVTLKSLIPVVTHTSNPVPAGEVKSKSDAVYEPINKHPTTNELSAITTTNCAAYGTAPLMSQDYEIPVVTSIPVPPLSAEGETNSDAVYEPIPN